MTIYIVSKNDTDVAHYNFNAHQPILVIFGRDVAERVCYRMFIFIPSLLTIMSLQYLGKHELQNCLFSHALSLIPCLDNDTAFGTCCRLRLLLGRKSVHCSVVSQLAERLRPCAEQCEEERHRSVPIGPASVRRWSAVEAPRPAALVDLQFPLRPPVATC